MFLQFYLNEDGERVYTLKVSHFIHFSVIIPYCCYYSNSLSRHVESSCLYLVLMMTLF